MSTALQIPGPESRPKNNFLNYGAYAESGDANKVWGTFRLQDTGEFTGTVAYVNSTSGSDTLENILADNQIKNTTEFSSMDKVRSK
jgi:hypothetical protein